MKIANKPVFFNQSQQTLEEITEWLENLPSLTLGRLTGKDTALVVMDMINGFANDGALTSPRIKELIHEIVAISKRCDEQGIAKLAFADNHTMDSPEFGAFPPHCLAGTREAELLDELKEIGDYTLIPKNSTNAFMEKGFQDWLAGNPHKNNFIVTGNCTDICILQFTLTLKSWFNGQNRKSRIIVPENAVNTYHSPGHNGDLAHLMALRNMHLNGIEIARGIE